MSDLRKYNTDALFIFPLVGDGVADFVGDYTPAAGDATLWSDTQISTALTSFILGFDSLSEIPNPGDLIEENGAGTAEAVIIATVIISGTAGGGDAAGLFFVRSVAGQAWTNNDQIDINGGTANIATADSTTYDLAATAGLIASLGNGRFAAGLTPTEMSCVRGSIHIIDSATKAIEDQAIHFTTEPPNVNVAQVSEDETAANNLRDMFNGTGYVDPTAPASRAQADGLGGGGGGGGIPIQATSDNTGGAIIDGVTFVGSVQSGTFASTEAEDGVYFDIDDVGDDIDVVLGYAVGGGRVGVRLTFDGFVQSITAEMKIKVYDHAGAAWDTIATIPGQVGIANIALEAPLLLKHTGPGSELGNVYIRIETDSTTPSNLSIDRLLVEAVNIGQSVGYANGKIWYNSNLSNTGVEPFVDGVADKATSLETSLKTLSGIVGIGDFHIINGSTVLLFESTVNESYFGDNWILQLGNQNVAGAYFQGAHVSGIGTSTAEVHYEGCDVATMSVQIGHFDFCSFSETVTHTLAGDYNYHNCYSKVSGSGSPIFAKTAGQAITAQWRDWQGGITFTGLEVGDTLTVGGRLGTVDLGSPAGAVAVELRGTYKEVINVGSAALNLDGAILASDVAAILVDTDTTIPALIAALNNLSSAEANAACDTAISDAALATAANLAVVDGVVDLIQAVTDLLPNAGALSDLATLATRLSATRAGYLDNLNNGLLSSQAEVLAIQNNTRTTIALPGVAERPDSGATRIKIYLNNYDTAGNMEAPDSAPTAAVENEEGTDRSGNLQHPTTHVPGSTMINLSTGRYWIEYNLDNADTLENLTFTFTIIEGGVTRFVDRSMLLVDTTAVDFTAADRAKLDTLHDTRLTDARAANLDELGAANIPADIDAIISAIASLNDPTLAAIADAVWDEIISSSLHNTAQSAGKRLRQTSDGYVSVEGAVDDISASTTVFNTNLTEVDDFYNDSLIRFTTGVLAGQARPILNYNQTNGQITLDEPLTSAPVDTVEFIIIATHIHPIAQIQAGLATAVALGIAQTDLDTITGADGVILAATQTAAWALRLALSSGQIILGTVDTVVNGHTPTFTEFQADNITEATTDHYKGRLVLFLTGNLAGQITEITGYSLVGGIGQFAVVATTEPASNNETFILI